MLAHTFATRDPGGLYTVSPHALGVLQGQEAGPEDDGWRAQALLLGGAYLRSSARPLHTHGTCGQPLIAPAYEWQGRREGIGRS